MLPSGPSGRSSRYGRLGFNPSVYKFRPSVTRIKVQTVDCRAELRDRPLGNAAKRGAWQHLVGNLRCWTFFKLQDYHFGFYLRTYFLSRKGEFEDCLNDRFEVIFDEGIAI